MQSLRASVCVSSINDFNSYKSEQLKAHKEGANFFGGQQSISFVVKAQTRQSEDLNSLPSHSKLILGGAENPLLPLI